MQHSSRSIHTNCSHFECNAHVTFSHHITRCNGSGGGTSTIAAYVYAPPYMGRFSWFFCTLWVFFRRKPREYLYIMGPLFPKPPRRSVHYGSFYGSFLPVHFGSVFTHKFLLFMGNFKNLFFFSIPLLIWTNLCMLSYWGLKLLEQTS